MGDLPDEVEGGHIVRGEDGRPTGSVFLCIRRTFY